MMRRFPALLLILFAAACGEDGPTQPQGGTVATISLSPATLQFGAVGSSAMLTATARDANDDVVASPSLTWTSQETSVVTVNASGVVTAAGNGTTTVTATSGSVTGSITVGVAQVPASIQLDPLTFDFVGETADLAAAVADSNGNPVEGAAVTFASSDQGTVFVRTDGTVVANYPGSAEVTVSASGGLSGSATFTVDVTGTEGAARLGAEVPCESGSAAGFPCDRMDLVSYMPAAGLGIDPASGAKLNDMWGWTDASTSRDYVLAARTDGLSFVDVTDRLRPRALGFLPSAGATSSWRDVKVYADHAYIVADKSSGHGIQIFDLTRLRDVQVFTVFSQDAQYTDVSSVHNIAINEATGFAYAVGSNSGGNTCGGGLHMVDLSSPASPVFAGCFADTTTGNSLTGYTHDVQCVVYAGPDAAYAGREICIGSNETAISVADVTDKGAPVAVSTASYPDARYVHQGWLTEDHAYFIQNDELDEAFGTVALTRMLVWDVTDLDDPVLVDEHSGPTGAIDHNIFIVGDVAYHSNYHFGIRVVDLSDPANPVEAGFFDTHPVDDAVGFDGSWSNYPFFEPGLVVVTSAFEGLFILQRQP